MTMQNQPQDSRWMEQTNRDGSTGIQSSTHGGTSYIAKEIKIYNSPTGTACDSNEEGYFEPPYNTPPSNTSQFIGREAELKQLHHLLQQGKVVAIADTTAKGGVGKTELAIQYCLRHLTEYPGGICWLFPKTSDIGIQIVEFARVQFMRVPVPEGVSLSSQVSFCWRNWCQGSTLLVIDNVTSPEFDQLKQLLPLNMARFKVLLTTRDRLRVPLQLPLGGLEKEAAMELAQVLMGDALLQQEANFTERLCALVGYSPLALHVFAGHIRPEVVSC